jgi:hypothetical protein
VGVFLKISLQLQWEITKGEWSNCTVIPTTWYCNTPTERIRIPYCLPQIPRRLARNQCRASAVPERRLSVLFFKGLKTARGKKDVASWNVSRLDGCKVVPEILADFGVDFDVCVEGGRNYWLQADCSGASAELLSASDGLLAAELCAGLRWGSDGPVDGLKESAFYCTW